MYQGHQVLALPVCVWCLVLTSTLQLGEAPCDLASCVIPFFNYKIIILITVILTVTHILLVRSTNTIAP